MTAESSRPRRDGPRILLLAIAFFLAPIFTASLTAVESTIFNPPVAFLALGILPTAIILLFVETAWGSYLPWTRRSAALAGWLGGATVWSTAVVSVTNAQSWRLLLILPWFVLAWQLPLWILRYLFGWRLLGAGPPIAEQWRLRHLFAATLFIAAALAALRLFARLEGRVDPEFMPIAAAGGLGSGLFLCLAFVLPAAWISERLTGRRWCGGVLLHGAIVIALPVLISRLMGDVFQDGNAATYVYAFFNFILFAATYFSLLVLTWSGYRITHGRKSNSD